MTRSRAYARDYRTTVLRCTWTDTDGKPVTVDVTDWPAAARVEASAAATGGTRFAVRSATPEWKPPRWR